MQPEPKEISEYDITSSNSERPANTSQHGFPLLDLQLSSFPSERQSAYAEPSFETDSTICHDGPASVLPLHLNEYVVCQKRPKPTVQRISEYENASSPSVAKKMKDGPYFQVVKRSGHSLNGPQLENFPNEVLTHILSHLPASSLSAVSLVSHRFYNLVTTPHAWRLAFLRFFLGQDALDSGIFAKTNRRHPDQGDREHIRTEQRFFTRLTALASWRSEYILRTRLLRSLTRGKPSQLAPGHGGSSRPASVSNTNAVVTYNSQLFATIDHIHGVFDKGRRSPRFIHGTGETGSASTSDPKIGKIDNWGLSDPQSLPQFADLFPGDQPYGLGDGQLVGAPNVMDISQPFGMIYGEGFPGGQTYFRSTDELRGRFLANSGGYFNHEIGAPRIPKLSEAICAVWVAKSHGVPSMTDGTMGIMTGSSHGVITAYSLGVDNLRENRLDKGEVTAKWMLSPGVPIIAISVDESYNTERMSAGRIFVVALNALGEVYYLIDPPQRASVGRASKADVNDLARAAWEKGRTVYWNLIECTRRVARDDPYKESEFDGSYSPRSSAKVMNLSKEQLVAETHEIEKFISLRPTNFRKVCEGWDMRRRLEVDFGGDDGACAGENIVVMECGLENGQIKRLTRLKVEQSPLDECPILKSPPLASTSRTMASLFAEAAKPITLKSKLTKPSRRSMSPISRNLSVEEWRTSRLSLQSLQMAEITTSAIDLSNHALLTIAEDPLLSMNAISPASSPFPTPPNGQASISVNTMPGQRARYIAVGTSTGAIIVWDMRGAYSSNSALVNEIQPMRVINSDSPQISCLALSALYLVHGGNDGLVQAWDPLASTLQPLRTLNSRFSSRARRRLVQAEASVQGVGINLFAAGAIILDPDPTVLRGMVSLGTHLRYWSYSSSAADQYTSRKRRLRRSAERGSNGGPDRFTNTGRGALMDYIATEQEELKKEKQRRAREEARLRGRFGVGLGGLSEDEALRYAEMISQETFEKDLQRRTSDLGYMADIGECSSTQSQAAWNSETVTPEGSVIGHVPSPRYKSKEDLDSDIEEAIRLSLIDGIDDGGRSPRASGSGEYEIPITFKKSRRSASSSPSTSQAPKSKNKVPASKKSEVAADDLDFALRLSLTVEESRQEIGDESGVGSTVKAVGDAKGKGRVP